jgi:ribosomal protein S12 methylthiotransferase accessory factor
MSQNDNFYYGLAPGVDVVRLGGTELLLRSAFFKLRLEGTAASLFLDNILPNLDGRHSASSLIADLPKAFGLQLLDLLQQLAKVGALVRRDTPGDTLQQGTLVDLFAAQGVDKNSVEQRLLELHVAVFGMIPIGIQFASLLARMNVGRLSLIDPYEASALDTAAIRGISDDSIGPLRQDLASAVCRGVSQISVIDTPLREALTRETITGLVTSKTVLVSCFGDTFASANHWINRASFQSRTPAIYANLEGLNGVVGPLVYPLETACYMCWRMRALGCDSDFREAMAYEEFLAEAKAPRQLTTAVYLPLETRIASELATQIIKTTLAIGVPDLAGKVSYYDVLNGRVTSEKVLARPDCPVCKKKDRLSPLQPTLEILRQESVPQTDILAAREAVVGAHTGIVKRLHRVPKDPSEPERPYIFRAELANHRFLHEPEAALITGSGKGFTEAAAIRGALGEALERYSGAAWNQDSVTYAKRGSLPNEALDPRELVLFDPSQYETLRYSPYRDDTTLGWLKAQSLTSTRCCYVPALAVLMAYEVPASDQFLFPITSSGLAAGPTLSSAILRATLEVVERDAFLAMWFHRLKCVRADPLSHPQLEIRSLCESYARRGIRMELFRIPLDHEVPVFIALGVAEAAVDGPAVTVGLGADLVRANAAASAILEVAQVRPALRIKLRDVEVRARMEALAHDATKVTELEDHDLLYASPRMLSRFDFLRTSPMEDTDWSEIDLAVNERLSRLIDMLALVDAEVMYVNLTPPDIASLGIHTARAIVPGFQPIHFGYNEPRLGGERLFTLPQRLGLRSTRARIADLNLEPHPLA